MQLELLPWIEGWKLRTSHKSLHTLNLIVITITELIHKIKKTKQKHSKRFTDNGGS